MNQFTPEELKALKTLLGRVQIQGNEAIAMTVLLQKIDRSLSEVVTEKKPIEKEKSK